MLTWNARKQDRKLILTGQLKLSPEVEVSPTREMMFSAPTKPSVLVSNTILNMHGPIMIGPQAIAKSE